MKKVCVPILGCLLLLCCGGCQRPDCHREIPQTVRYLSSDKLEGRLPNTEGNRLTKNFIEESLENNQIATYFEKGCRHAYSYQVVDVSGAAIRTEGLQLSYPQGFQLIDCPVKETGLPHSGSYRFSRAVARDYQAVYTINIDCTGGKGRGAGHRLSQQYDPRAGIPGPTGRRYFQRA